jgi:hypothetical protein
MNKAREIFDTYSNPNFEKVLKVINKMIKDKIINDYSVVGGYALLYYAQPIPTYDVDIAIVVNSDKLIYDMSNIYKYLSELGYSTKEEYVIIYGMPVQFIMAQKDSVLDDAINNHKIERYKATNFNIISLEYVIVNMLYTGRNKDKLKLITALEDKEVFDKIDKNELRRILDKFNLTSKWNLFKIKLNN